MKKYIVSSTTIGGKEYNHYAVKLASRCGAVVEGEYTDGRGWYKPDTLQWLFQTKYRAIVTPDMPKEIQDLVNEVESDGDFIHSPMLYLQQVGRAKRTTEPHPHKWKDVIIAMANGISVEFKTHHGEWCVPDCRETNPITCSHWEWRIKPRTIMIGDMEVPEPLRDAPEKDTTYFIADPSSDDLFYAETWDCDNIDIRYLRRGQCHATEDAAIAHAKALIVASGGEV